MSSARSRTIRESVEKRLTQIRAKLRRLDEAFLYESSIDRTTYEKQRERLREERPLAELELSEARVEQFDIDSALAKAISVPNNASALWIDASFEDRVRLQEVLFPQGLVWDGVGFQTPITCSSFYYLMPIEGRTGSAPDRWSSNPTNLCGFQRVAKRIRAGVNDGTGTGSCEKLERDVFRNGCIRRCTVEALQNIEKFVSRHLRGAATDDKQRSG
jgi:hypothetical protein